MQYYTTRLLLIGTLLLASNQLSLAQDFASTPWTLDDEQWENATDLWEHEKYSNALFGY